MNTNSCQPSSPEKSWNALYKAPSTLLTTVSKGVGSVCSTVYYIWTSTPKAVKILPLGAAIYNSSLDWKIKAPAAALLAISEIPKEMVLFMRGKPLNFRGDRYQILNTPLPDDPKAPLTELDKKINKFERVQARISKILPHENHPPACSASIPSATFSDDMKKATDHKLDILIEKVSYFSMLQAMHAASGLREQESTPYLLRIVDTASRKFDDKKPSLWTLFVSSYGSQMSWWGKFKAGITYLFLWHWVPIIPKTVNAYLKNILHELRINLKDNGEKRIKFINGILEGGDNLLEIYNGAAETYVEDHARKGNLNHYRKAAIDLHVLTNDISDPKKSLEEIRLDFFRKLSHSIIDNWAPIVPFRFLEGWINKQIRKQLREKILPEVFLNASNQSKEATKRHNTPFFLALTKTMTAQMVKLQGKLEHGSSDASPLSGKHFEGIVKKWMRAVDLAGCTTPQEVKAKFAELEKRQDTGLNAAIRKGIQEGIQKGMAALFDYLSKGENTEDLFAILFESVSEPLSGKLPMTEKEWKEIATEYEGAKIVLKQSATSLLNEILEEVVQDQVHGGKTPEAADRAARKIFAEHQKRGNEAFYEIANHCQRIQEKIKQGCSSIFDIHQELNTITGILKGFENEERVKITLDQDPPPPLATLPNADIESILRSLSPLYEGANHIMNYCSSLQELQQHETAFSQLLQKLRNIKEILNEIVQKNDASNLLNQISRINHEIPGIDEFSQVPKQTHSLKTQLQFISEKLAQKAAHQKTIDALNELWSFPGHSQPGLIHQLSLCAQGTPPLGFRKLKCIEQIKEKIKIAIPLKGDQDQLFALLEQINKYHILSESRTDFHKTIWKPLEAFFTNQKQRLDLYQQHVTVLIEKTIPTARQMTDESIAIHEQTRQENWAKMNQQGSLLQAEGAQLHAYIYKAQKEQQIHLSDAQLGQIGGLLGLGFGTAAVLLGSWIGGETGGRAGGLLGGFLGSGAAYLVRNLGKLAKKQEKSLAAESFAVGLAGGVFTEWVSHQTVVPPIVIGAAAASIGLQYAGSKFTAKAFHAGKTISLNKVLDIFNKTYDDLLTNGIFINGIFEIIVNQLRFLFPPKSET